MHVPPPIVCPLSELSRSDLAVAGGKGKNLGEMIRLGFPVPPGFVVTAPAYAEQARRWGLAERLGPHLASKSWDAAAAEAAALCQDGALSPEIEAAIRQAHRSLGAERVAVRSSATAEDLEDASFAGQQETLLDVEGEDAVIAAIRRCWASLHGARALHYRDARGVSHADVTMAVVVQKMVPADAAGVLFTVDPVEQRSDRMLLSAAPGLGEAVVSGHRRGDTYRIRRTPFGDSAGSAPGTDALAVVDHDLETIGRPALADAVIQEACRFGLSLEAHFGCPQDIELAVAEGRVFLLQSRPITTLGPAELESIEPLGDLDFLQRRAIGGNDDRFPIAPKPLDMWVLRGAGGAISHVLRYMGLDIDAADEEAMFKPLWRETIVPPKTRLTPRLFGLPGRVKRALTRDWEGWWQSGQVQALMESSAPRDLTALGDAELLAAADHAIAVFSRILGDRFEALVGLMGLAVLGAGARFAVGQRASALVADLIGGLHTKTSELNRALFELSREAIAAGPEVASAVQGGRIAELERSEAGRAFLDDFNAFLEKYGHREGAALYLSAPVWRHDPEPVWHIVRGFLSVSELPEDGGGVRYRAALAEIEARLGFWPGLLSAYRGILERVRYVIVFRENTHFDLTRPLPFLQAVAAEVGRRLHERGALPDPRDLFYLSEAEVKAWLCGEPPSIKEVRALLRRRRATYQVVNARWIKRRIPVAGTSTELRGIGASAGVVKGKVRIVRGEHQFDRLKPGEILVCAYTNPAWTPLFAYAGGVVTNTGGTGSHAAIVAREYGIPAVMGTGDATERLVDGQDVVVDGLEGRVILAG